MWLRLVLVDAHGTRHAARPTAWGRTSELSPVHAVDLVTHLASAK